MTTKLRCQLILVTRGVQENVYLQAALAELRLEVSAAQQLSSHATSQMPQLYKAADRIQQWNLFGDYKGAPSPKIAASVPGDFQGNSLKQIALMRQIQESVAGHTGQIASMEGMLCTTSLTRCIPACRQRRVSNCGMHIELVALRFA